VADRTQALLRFVEARGHLDRVIGRILAESPPLLIPTGAMQPAAAASPASTYRTSEAIANAIAALDLAFDAWHAPETDPGRARGSSS
jgi:hypothetical protein